MNGNGSTLQLAYFFSPDVMGQSVAGQNPVTLDLVVMISNPTDAPVEVTHVTIEIPSGQDISGDISSATTLPNPVYDTTIPWSITMSSDTVTVRPNKGNTAFVTGPILFTIPGIVVNDTPGTVQLIVTEYYPPPTPKAEDNTTYTLVKQPTTVPVSQFLVTPSVVTNIDARVTLSWTCTSQGVNDSFGLRIQSTEQPRAPATSDKTVSRPASPPPGVPGLRPCGQSGQCYTAKEGAAGIPYAPISATTTFALDVFRPSSTGSLVLVTTLYATVQVVVPSIFQESNVVGGRTGQLARAYWSTQNTTSCSLMVDGETVLTGLPADTYQSGYPVLLGSTPSPHLIELVAHGVNAGANATMTLGDVRVTPFAPIPTDPKPLQLAITPDGSLAFALSVTGKSLTPINLQTTPPTGEPAIPLSESAQSMALTPDGTHLLVPLTDHNQVVNVDVAQRQVVTIDNVTSAFAIAITPDGSQALVGGVNDSVATLIDVPNNQVLASIGVVDSPMYVAITPDGRLGLLLSGTDGQISVVDVPQRQAEEQYIPAGIVWGAITITPDGKTAVAVATSSPHFAVIDIPTRSVVASGATAGPDAGPAVITPDGTLAFIPSQNGQAVSVLNIAARKIETTIPVGGNPTDLAITPDGLMLLVLLMFPQCVAAIDVPSLTLTPLNVPVGDRPYVLQVTPDGASVLVASFTDNNVTII